MIPAFPVSQSRAEQTSFSQQGPRIHWQSFESFLRADQRRHPDHRTLADSGPRPCYAGMDRRYSYAVVPTFGDMSRVSVAKPLDRLLILLVHCGRRDAEKFRHFAKSSRLISGGVGRSKQHSTVREANSEIAQEPNSEHSRQVWGQPLEVRSLPRIATRHLYRRTSRFMESAKVSPSGRAAMRSVAEDSRWLDCRSSCRSCPKLLGILIWQIGRQHPGEHAVE